MKKKKRRRPLAVIKSTGLERQNCPACGADIEGATGVGIGPVPTRPVPVPGAFIVCVDCGTVNIFDENLRARLATPAELRDAPELVQVFQRWVRRERPSRRAFRFQ